MANVLHPHIAFQPRPISHAPSPFGFGFGLGPSTSMSSTGWGSSTPGHTNPAAFHQLASSVTQSASSRPQKRRHDTEEESDNGRSPTPPDESMERSPSPERPKRGPPKRARVVNDASAKRNMTSKENQAPDNSGADDVDIGVLLASLPTESLLPLLSSLLKKQPSLKSIVLPLIPRPTLTVAMDALAQSAKRLREAYPYSNNQTYTPAAPTFGATASNSAFGQPSPAGPSSQSAMRDAYIISRLGPHVADYVATCMSYIPYFSCLPAPQQQQQTSSSNAGPVNSAHAIHSLHKDKFHPSETFLFLQAITNQIASQPSLTVSELEPLIIPRLAQEWQTWVDQVDEAVNRRGGMFGSETVRSWERGLSTLADSKAREISEVMKVVRDNWVHKVGWLVGRTTLQPMDQL